MHGKNASGEGSAYQTADGRWVATWNEPGRAYPSKATGKTRAEAVGNRTERMGRPLAGDGSTWLENVYRPKVSIDTWHKAFQPLCRSVAQSPGQVPVSFW